MTVRSLLALAGVVVGLALAPQPAAAAPSIVYVCSPAPVDCSGWYREPVSLDWTVAGAPSTGTCEDRTLALDTPSSHQACIATEGAAVVSIVSWQPVGTALAGRTVQSTATSARYQPEQSTGAGVQS